MSEEWLVQYLDRLPVSAGAVRVMVALISRGAVETEVALSNVELGRMAFANEAVPLGAEALKKRTLKFVQELEKAQALQVSAVKVGKGHGRNKYRVTLDPEMHRGRQEVREAPKTPLRQAETFQPAGTGKISLALRPKGKRTLPPHVLEMLRQKKKT